MLLFLSHGKRYMPKKETKVYTVQEIKLAFWSALLVHYPEKKLISSLSVLDKEKAKLQVQNFKLEINSMIKHYTKVVNRK